MGPEMGYQLLWPEMTRLGKVEHRHLMGTFTVITVYKLNILCHKPLDLGIYGNLNGYGGKLPGYHRVPLDPKVGHFLKDHGVPPRGGGKKHDFCGNSSLDLCGRITSMRFVNLKP